jgi:hypothetical protein
MDYCINTTENLKYSGFFKIWQVDKKTGAKELVISKPNMILYQGADLLAKALAGVKYASISHMYVGFQNGAVTPTTIDKTNSSPFSSFVAPKGYLRLPISYNPSFLAQTNYSGNTVIFTSIIASTAGAHGDTFTASSSNICEVGLAAALNPENDGEDLFFSRATFDPIVYDSNYNLTISWGVNFLA